MSSGNAGAAAIRAHLSTIRRSNVWGGGKLRRALIASTALAVFAAPVLARADDFLGLGILPGGSYSQAFGVSANGSVVVGSTAVGSSAQAFRWTSGGMVGFGFMPGGALSQAYAVNADGSVVVGFGTSTSSAGGEAFRWTSGGGMAGLGFLPGGSYSTADAVNADGSVVVGYGNSTNAGGTMKRSAGRPAAWSVSACCREDLSALPVA